MSIDRIQRIFLLTVAVGLAPIALAYGVAPQATLPWLVGIDAADADVRHIFRAMMGLYLAMVALWIAGAVHASLRRPALWGLLVFMSGIGLGRLFGLALDGWPSPFLVLSLVAEVALAAVAVWLIRSTPGRHP